MIRHNLELLGLFFNFSKIGMLLYIVSVKHGNFFYPLLLVSICSILEACFTLRDMVILWANLPLPDSHPSNTQNSNAVFYQHLIRNTSRIAVDVKEKVKDTAKDVKEKVKDAAKDVTEKVKDVSEKVVNVGSPKKTKEISGISAPGTFPIPESQGVVEQKDEDVSKELE